MPFGKAKRTVVQDVQALDHVREELLALRGEVSALRTEKRLKDAFIGRDEADMKKRLEGLTDVAHNAMQKAWALQKHNECMQRDLDLANSNRYLSEGYRPPGLTIVEHDATLFSQGGTSRYNLYDAFADHILNVVGGNLLTVEVAFGDGEHALVPRESSPNYKLIQVRSKSRLWTKESQLNSA
ncbi:hypothetical protein CVIRNUC_004538 [Coccomyxa viridis]|uniref:Uncharacterized protein n=1 Tax=Coccomyxa viridis TaxID=1274662 RepID=A0AAV1I699_9CHLO|nr:hypothetical protein CVIRNUC_004538 [Coccomyxa viridis]